MTLTRMKQEMLVRGANSWLIVGRRYDAALHCNRRGRLERTAEATRDLQAGPRNPELCVIVIMRRNA